VAHRAEDSLGHVGVEVAQNNSHVFFLQIHRPDISKTRLSPISCTVWRQHWFLMHI